MTELHQMTLDELRRSRRDDPETSKAAAAKSHGLAAAHCALIRGVLWASAYPLTSHEIAERCGLQPVQVSRRLGQMRDEGDIVVAGIAETPSGRTAQTWRIA